MPVNRLPLKIGTRGSPLALYQAHAVAAALRQTDPALDRDEAFEIVVIRTSGDRIQDRRLAEIGGKALFTQEIERALTAGEIDLAVHSAKDVETELTPGSLLAAVLPRADRRDAFIAPQYGSIANLPQGGTVGTASLRRQAQLLRLRPDLKVVLFRGNVETRLRKLADGDVDATFLAAAGLQRLGKEEAITALLEPAEMMPAAGQGAIVVQARESNPALLALLAQITHTSSAAEVRAERAVLASLGGSCDTPVGVMAVSDPSDSLNVSAVILRPDGSRVWRASASGSMADAESLGTEVGTSLAKQCDPDLLIPASGASTGPDR
jgi:hydroxymethylbilane synthase